MVTRMDELRPGEPAPPFSLEDQHGEVRTLESFRGRRLLVYFYPRANTPG